jgi:hypothetical protein
VLLFKSTSRRHPILIIFPFFFTLLIGIVIAVVSFLVFLFIWTIQVVIWYRKMSKIQMESVGFALSPWVIGVVIIAVFWVLSAVGVFGVGYFFMPPPSVNGASIKFLMVLALFSGAAPGLGVTIACIVSSLMSLVLCAVWFEKSSAHHRTIALEKRAAFMALEAV